jgi:NADPH:quinone reductase-like Zn-dependent oxidoreductase
MVPRLKSRSSTVTSTSATARARVDVRRRYSTTSSRDIQRYQGDVDRPVGLGDVDVDAVEVGLDGDGDPFDLVLESVGGPLLAAAVQRIRPGGQIVSYGMSSEQATKVSARGLYLRNAASISGFFLFDELVGFGGGAATLARLLALVADGSLDPGVATVADWHDAASVVRRLLDREIAGKAVVDIG